MDKKTSETARAEKTVLLDKNFDILCISKATVDRILKECDHVAECLALYCFYYYTARWQKTNHAKASISYCSKGLNIAESRVRTAKHELEAIGLVEDFKRVDKKSGKVLGWYVLVKYVSFENHPYTFPDGGDFHRVDNCNPNALSTGSLNAFSTGKEMLVEANASPDTELMQSKQALPAQAGIRNVPAEAVKLAETLAAHVLRINPKAKNLNDRNREKTISSWAGYIDKINRIDGREWREIERVLNFANNDSFWNTNVLSGDSLRKQFDKLYVKAVPARKSTQQII